MSTPFSFGSAPTTGTAPAAPSLFSFGSQNSSTAPSSASATQFSFGSVGTSNPATAAPASGSAPSINLFGGASAPGPIGASSATAFSFGGNTTTTTTSANNAPSAAPTTAPISFGGSAAPTAGATSGFSFTGASSGSAPSIGASSTPAAPASFSFGSTNNQPAAPASSAAAGTSAAPISFGLNSGAPAVATDGSTATNPSGFTFGAPAATASSATPATSSAPTVPSFGFSAAAPTAAAAAATASFTIPKAAESAASSAAPVSFNFQGAAATTAPATTENNPANATVGTAAASAAAPAATSGFNFFNAPATGSANAAAANSLVVAEVKNAVTSTPASEEEQEVQKDVDRMSNWTLKKLVSTLEADLHAYQEEFFQKVKQYEQWDKEYVHTANKFTELHSGVRKTHEYCEALEIEHAALVEQQKAIDDDLDQLENSQGPLQNAWASLSQRPMSVEQMERNACLQVAENLHYQLSACEHQTDQLVSAVHHAEERRVSNASGRTPIFAIMRILDAHARALQYSEAQCVALSQSIKEVSEVAHAQLKYQAPM